MIRLKQRLMGWSRERKYRQFLRLAHPGPGKTILDVGPADREYSEHDNYLEKRLPLSHRITALTRGSGSRFHRAYPHVRTVVYDGGRFPFKDRSFDIGHANAVLEHVGDFHEQVFFIEEMNRVCRQAYLTTPNRGFPLELHTHLPVFHWLSKPRFDAVLRRLGKSWAAGAYMRLLTRRDLEALLLAAGISAYHIHSQGFMGLSLHLALWIQGE